MGHHSRPPQSRKGNCETTSYQLSRGAIATPRKVSCQVPDAVPFGAVRIPRDFDSPDKASLGKARRRGLRRTTSALTTTILGAVLTSSTISAQQFQPSDNARRDSPAASASATEPAPAPASPSSTMTPTGADANTDSITGMAATRGARYLLRNGLDYINYQEYERALKYLREAEARQKQLTDAEKLKLKQAIERAQRGLREAVGSQAPYALSRRSRQPGGFAPAQPDTRIGSLPASAEPRVSQALPRPVASREGDDLGQPIRLAGAEIATPSPVTAAKSPAPSPSPGAEPAADGMPQPLPIGSDQPARLPDIPKLSQLHEQAAS